MRDYTQPSVTEQSKAGFSTPQWPQPVQNFWPAGFDWPQPEHVTMRGVLAPHSPQKRESSAFSCWQAGHCIGGDLSSNQRRGQSVGPTAHEADDGL